MSCNAWQVEVGALLTDCALQDAGTAATSSVLQQQEVGPVISVKDGAFSDYRWKDGRWDLSRFTGADSKVDWDAVSLCQQC